MDDFDLWKELLDYARWAPSPHNVQTWKVKLISATEAELFYDPNRLLPDEDPTGRFLMTGIGVFLEALNIAAKAKGYSVNAKFFVDKLDSKSNGLTPLANLTLTASQERDNLDRELIKQRRTSRLAYEKRMLDGRVVNELKSVAQNFGQTLTLSSEPATVDWVLKLNRDTMFYDMNDDKARNEVGSWARFSAKEAYEKKDGLWSYCMNTPSFIMYLFFNARWIINLPGIYQLIGTFYLSTTQTSTVAWLQGPFQNSKDWLNSGRMLMRLWLTMTKHGIYLHPFGSIITNAPAHKRLRDKFNVDESKNSMWLIMRLGYSKQPPRSVRLNLEDIIIQ
jgi:hypothetical protein